MGNEPSLPSNTPPVVRKLYTCLLLENVPEKNRTRSMVHKGFSDQIGKTEATKISRNMSPFCPLDIQNQSNWISTCFISPIMLIASPLFLCNKEGELEKQLKVLPVYNDSITTIPIKSAINIAKEDICLLTLEEPYWKVGWAGVTFIKSIEDLREANLKIVDHPERMSSSHDDEMVHVQVSKNYYLPKKPTETNPYAVDYNGITGSIICKIENKKPYIVGIQASEYETIFFNEQNYNKLSEAAKGYMKDHNQESEIIKKFNLQEFEKETNW